MLYTAFGVYYFCRNSNENEVRLALKKQSVYSYPGVNLHQIQSSQTSRNCQDYNARTLAIP